MEKYSVDKLAKWKKKEEDFKIRMVDIGKHGTLLNIYNFLASNGKQQSRMCKETS